MIPNWNQVNIVPEFCDQGVDCYRLVGGDFLNEYFIVSEAETRKLMNHPEVVGYEVYTSLLNATSQMLYYLKEQRKITSANILSILRGALNYPLEESCYREHIRVLTIQDAVYPQRLLQIYDPPLVLYVRGTLPQIDDRAAVAVVGTRSATPYGMRTARKFGSEIVRHGGILLSGLTAGIDRSAAEGALHAGGICVGVSGTAINLDFAGACTQEVARCGAVVSEFAPNMSVTRFGFRLRNRITSGLAVATVVVEAPEKSGALLFADDAVTQGREVFAVPGNADSRASVGSNALLKDGARPATCAWDVLSDFRRMFPGTLHENIAPEPDAPVPEPPPETGSGFAQVRRPVAEKRIDKPQPEAYIDLEAQLKSLTTEQLQIVAAIDAPGTQVDLIIEKTQLPASKVLAELTVLQIRGVVRQEPGKRFSLNVRAGTAQQS